MQLAGLKDGYSKQGLDKLPQNAFLYVVDSWSESRMHVC